MQMSTEIYKNKIVDLICQTFVIFAISSNCAKQNKKNFFFQFEILDNYKKKEIKIMDNH